MNFKPGWGSHIPMLVKIMNVSKGDVLELGIGPCSTPILHWMCFDQDRKLTSYETDSSFCNKFKRYITDFHKITQVDKWEDVDIKKKWGLVFVDQHPSEERALSAIKVAKLAHYVILHDTEPRNAKFYTYDRAFPHFKYRFDYNKHKKGWTTVLSNFHKLDFLNEGTTTN